MIKKYTLTLLLTTYFFLGIAQKPNTAKLDSLLNAVESNNKGMGSLAISQNGQLVYQKAFGITSLPKQAATINTRYRIGSISKMFTAVMIFQLIEENKLSLSTSLAKFYPQLFNSDKITIGMMLSHRSGLYNFTRDPAYLNYMLKPHTEKEMLTIIALFKSDFEPDSRASYSNTNFLLLGYIVEKLDARSYSESLKKRITDKINLTNTYYGQKINTTNKEAFSFTYSNGWQQQPETDMSIPGGAGGVVSTPSDLVKFIEALFSEKLIIKKYLDSMMTIKNGYGMGMSRVKFFEHISYGHSGSIDGFSSILGYFPEEKRAFAYITNGMSENYTDNNIVGGVLKIYFNRPFTIPKF